MQSRKVTYEWPNVQKLSVAGCEFVTCSDVTVPVGYVTSGTEVSVFVCLCVARVEETA